MIDPIEKLTEGAERIATGDFDETLAVESTDEIGVLTTTFNDMASVLHSTLEAVENERNKLDTLFQMCIRDRLFRTISSFARAFRRRHRKPNR